jgi:hypothetical protein
MRLLREHPEWRCVHTAPGLDEEAERVVCLAGVGRPEVGDHRLGLDAPFGQANRQL